MSVAKSIARNAFYMYLGDIFSKLLTFIFIIALARYFGPEDFGIYSFALAFTSFLYFAIDFGTNRVFVREIACNKRKFEKLFSQCLTSKMFFSLIFLPFFVLLVFLIGKPSDTVLLVLLFGVAVMLNSFTEFIKAVYRSFERMEFESIIKITDKLFWLCTAGIVIFFGLSLKAFAFLFILSSIMNLLVSVIFLQGYFRRNIKIHLSLSKRLLLKAAPFALSATFYIIFYKIDIVMLSIMKGDVTTGIYNASYQFIEALITLPFIFQAVLYPVLSRTFSSSVTTYKIIFRKTIKLLFIFIVPVVIGTTLLADRFVLLFFGSEYSSSIPVLIILIWAAIFIYFGHLASPFLMAGKQERLIAKILVFMVFINIGLNIFLIPAYGAEGAAIATVFTEFCFALVTFIFIKRLFSMWSFNIYVIKIVFAGIFMGVVTYFIQNLHLLLVILISAATYSVLIILLKTFTKEDFDILKGVLPKKFSKISKRF